jgi:NAD(P)H-hydrate epimerase
MTWTRMTELPAPPERPPEAHKGTFGSALIVGGSRGMSGAVALSGLAALRGGAGLVFVAVPAGVLSIVGSIEPSYLTILLPEDSDGRIDESALEPLMSHAAGRTALAVGPGLGQSAGLRTVVRELFLNAALPAVFDADALNALSQQPEIWDAWKASPAGPRVLTPHPGEFSRLTGKPISNVQSHREDAAAEFAAAHGVVVVLKGPRTVITDGSRLAVNTTGNSGMATGGTGDVLTGLTVSLLAQRMPAFEAAQLAAHLHGLAGDLAAEALSQPALIASDLPRYLGAAWKRLCGERG